MVCGRTARIPPLRVGDFTDAPSRRTPFAAFMSPDTVVQADERPVLVLA